MYRTKRFSLSLLLLAVAGCSTGQNQSIDPNVPVSIMVTELTLVDQDGKGVAVLTTKPDGSPTLQMSHYDGAYRLEMTAYERVGTEFAIIDRETDRPVATMFGEGNVGSVLTTSPLGTWSSALEEPNRSSAIDEAIR